MLKRLNTGLTVLGAVALFAVIAITLYDIALALFTGRPYSGVYDLVEAFLAAAVFLALPMVFHDETNIQVTLIDGLLGRTARAVVLFIARLATLVFVVVVAYSMIAPFRDTIRFQDRLYETGLAVWIIWVPILIGIALSILMVLVTFRRSSSSTTQEADLT